MTMREAATARQADDGMIGVPVIGCGAGIGVNVLTGC